MLIEVVKQKRKRCICAPHIFGPEDVWSKHGGQIDGGHFIQVLIAGGVVQQVEEQLQKAAVGCWQQHEEQLKGFDLTVLVQSIRLIPVLIKEGELWTEHIRNE